MRTVTFLILAVFLLLYGLAAVTNFSVAYMGTITGFAALAAGVLLVILVARKEV